ncbi:MAG TPA: ECF-type sigma factor [Thermoanaerobaculia bacterium]|jgi:RNA polymerase sigma factor (TIGR02999 family)
MTDFMPLVYDELRRVAASYLARERSGHTLQPTALVHEVYLRMAQGSDQWNGKTHFFAVAARAMRRLLIDHARARGRDKRGADWERVTFELALTPQENDFDRTAMLALDQALQKLAALDPRQAEVVELRFFSGLTIEEIAAYLGLSKRTIEAEWTHARAWLRRELDR